MNLDEMKRLKREKGYSLKMISELSGVPFGTVQKIFNGATKAPRFETLKALEKALADGAGESREAYVFSLPSETASVRESTFEYKVAQYPGLSDNKKVQGEYTVEDYYNVSKDRRIELISGVIYDLASPTKLHQAILRELTMQFYRVAESHGGECEVFFAPLDVQLDEDDRTMVQPDLFLLCRSYEEGRAIMGAPDFILEILSDSTAGRDCILKLYKYKNAGVREYWIVDSVTRRVTVYNFTAEIGCDVPIQYTFDDEVPISISNGEYSIDFKTIREKLTRYYE